MAKFVQTTLIDGYAGGPHVTEVQLGLAHQATFGPDDYVLEGGRKSEAQVLTNNSIRIFDAVYCIQGRRDVIPASGYTDVTIANGTQGMNRNDIIVRRYKKDESSEIETTEYAVIKGTPNAGEAVDPEVTIGDIRTGATLHEMKLYRVKIKGLNITAVEPLFNILKNMAVLQQEIAQTNKDLSNKVAELNKNITSVKSVNKNITKMIAGSKVVNAKASTSVQVFTNSEINKALGVTNSSNANTVVLMTNGDGLAQKVHVEGSTYLNSAWHATFNQDASAGSIRINYVIFYFGYGVVTVE